MSSKKKIEELKELERRNHFKDHIIIENSIDDWIFKKPDTITYSMQFIIRGSRVIIIGDCFDWVFARSDAKTLLLSATSKDYFWEKCSSRKEEFSEKKTKDLLIEYITENYDDDEQIKERGTLKQLKAKIKRESWSFPQEALQFIDTEFPFLQNYPSYEFLCYSWSPEYDTMWSGLEVFREKYWAIHGTDKPIEKKNEPKKHLLTEYVGN